MSLQEMVPNLGQTGTRKTYVSQPWFQTAVVLAELAGIASAFFFMLRPSPAFSTLPWVPDCLGHWADAHGRFRNFPAYALLAMPFLLGKRAVSGRALAVALLAALAATLELAQFFIPTRYVDVQDIFWSWSGLLASWALIEGIRLAARVFKSPPLDVMVSSAPDSGT